MQSERNLSTLVHLSPKSLIIINDSPVAELYLICLLVPSYLSACRGHTGLIFSLTKDDEVVGGSDCSLFNCLRTKDGIAAHISYTLANNKKINGKWLDLLSYLAPPAHSLSVNTAYFWRHHNLTLQNTVALEYAMNNMALDLKLGYYRKNIWSELLLPSSPFRLVSIAWSWVVLFWWEPSKHIFSVERFVLMCTWPAQATERWFDVFCVLNINKL